MDKECLNEMRKNFAAQFEPAVKQYDEIIQLLELAELGLNPKKPNPTHFTTREGGEWIEWHNRGWSNTNKAHSIKFSDGSIFDMVNGWRDVVATKTMETANQIAGQDKPSIPDCAYLNIYDGKFHSRLTGEFMGTIFQKRWESRKEEFSNILPYFEARTVSSDQRIVQSGLLEHCLGIFEGLKIEFKGSLYYETKFNKDLDLAISQLKAALVIKKASCPADGFHSKTCAKTIMPEQNCDCGAGIAL